MTSAILSLRARCQNGLEGLEAPVPSQLESHELVFAPGEDRLQLGRGEVESSPATDPAAAFGLPRRNVPTHLRITRRETRARTRFSHFDRILWSGSARNARVMENCF